MSTEVRINTALERFEIYVDGDIAGYTEFQDTASERAFVHTEIFPGYERRGYATELIGTALRASRGEGFGILPMCSMVRHFVEINPQFISSVPQWARGRMGLPQ
ncbi:MAG TPA: GNAT family N-acetyltransferase [Nocardia sp.]|uniref:GNAT family N-acetyltransferase n=1 Tax=Nocardia TaxID=1817 RepID=UPI00245703F9|nr:MULTISPECIES: GNAT family N-acetyltransferase [Nocardia]HLS79294.1 GNAT family N-acetyltransferase [Nocardia sp.]